MSDENINLTTKNENFQFKKVKFQCIQHGWIHHFVIDSNDEWVCPECFHKLKGAQCRYHLELDRESDLSIIGHTHKFALCNDCLEEIRGIVLENDMN